MCSLTSSVCDLLDESLAERLVPEQGLLRIVYRALLGLGCHDTLVQPSTGKALEILSIGITPEDEL